MGSGRYSKFTAHLLFFCILFSETVQPAASVFDIVILPLVKA